MFIYADILIITNIYVDFLLIKSASVITRSRIKTSRCILGAVVGSLFSLAIFIPSEYRALVLPLKLVSSAVTVFSAFGYESFGQYFRRLAVFYLCSFIYGGIGTCIAWNTNGRFITARHGIVYADFSMPALVITSVIAYFGICIFKRITGADRQGTYKVIVSDMGKVVSFEAVSDTGNLLKDSFTGKNVIVCPRSVLCELYGNIPDTEDISAGNAAQGRKWRFIPCTTISSSGLIAVICPREVCIKCNETGELFRADVYLGAASNEASSAVFNPEILV